MTDDQADDRKPAPAPEQPSANSPVAADSPAIGEHPADTPGSGAAAELDEQLADDVAGNGDRYYPPTQNKDGTPKTCGKEHRSVAVRYAREDHVKSLGGEDAFLLLKKDNDHGFDHVFQWNADREALEHIKDARGSGRGSWLQQALDHPDHGREAHYKMMGFQGYPLEGDHRKDFEDAAVAYSRAHGDPEEQLERVDSLDFRDDGNGGQHCPFLFGDMRVCKATLKRDADGVPVIGFEMGERNTPEKGYMLMRDFADGPRTPVMRTGADTKRELLKGEDRELTAAEQQQVEDAEAAWQVARKGCCDFYSQWWPSLAIAEGEDDPSSDYIFSKRTTGNIAFDHWLFGRATRFLPDIMLVHIIFIGVAGAGKGTLSKIDCDTCGPQMSRAKGVSKYTLYSKFNGEPVERKRLLGDRQDCYEARENYALDAPKTAEFDIDYSKSHGSREDNERGGLYKPSVHTIKARGNTNNVNDMPFYPEDGKEMTDRLWCIPFLQRYRGTESMIADSVLRAEAAKHAPAFRRLLLEFIEMAAVDFKLMLPEPDKRIADATMSDLAKALRGFQILFDDLFVPTEELPPTATRAQYFTKGNKSFHLLVGGEVQPAATPWAYNRDGLEVDPVDAQRRKHLGYYTGVVALFQAYAASQSLPWNILGDAKTTKTTLENLLADHFKLERTGSYYKGYALSAKGCAAIYQMLGRDRGKLARLLRAMLHLLPAKVKFPSRGDDTTETPYEISKVSARPRGGSEFDQDDRAWKLIVARLIDPEIVAALNEVDKGQGFDRAPPERAQEEKERAATATDPAEAAKRVATAEVIEDEAKRCADADEAKQELLVWLEQRCDRTDTGQVSLGRLLEFEGADKFLPAGTGDTDIERQSALMDVIEKRLAIKLQHDGDRELVLTGYQERL